MVAVVVAVGVVVVVGVGVAVVVGVGVAVGVAVVVGVGVAVGVGVVKRVSSAAARTASLFEGAAGRGLRPMRLHGDHVGEDSEEGAGQVKKAIRWPAKFYKAERGKYVMIAEAGGRPVTASLARLFHDRWAFNVAEGPVGEMSFLHGYAHTMAAAKRCAHRDMVFLLKRAGVKGAL